MTAPTYTQPVKNEVRRRVLTQAIAALTSERAQSAIVRADEFQATLDYAMRELVSLPRYIDWLPRVQHEAEAWMAFHNAQVGSKRPGDLRVLYLCGPEPVNDLELLLSLGVIPQNIWAIEGERAVYDSAIAQLKRHSSYIRVHLGKLDRFFEQVHERFDLIYIDACGPLPSGSPNTLRLPLAMFQHERLASLGALVTTFAEPSSDNDAYIDILTQYFAPRYTDVPAILQQDDADPAIAHAEPEYLKPFVSRRMTEVYSDFVTRFLVDLARHIVPQRRVFANQDLRRKYFAGEKELASAKSRATATPKFDPGMTDEQKLNRFFEQIGDIYLTPHAYPVTSFLRRIERNSKAEKLLEPLINQKIEGVTTNDALLTMGLLEHIIEGHVAAASTEMQNALRSSWFDVAAHVFCDAPLPNLLVNTLFGIYGHPYQVNPRQSLRLAYTAKATPMYLDCLLFDQCRYYFDFLPTIDLMTERMKSRPFQLVLRTCLDRMGRHDWSSSSHPFRGAALASFGDIPEAKAYEFEERTKVVV